jgi:hypothetical protein
MLKAITIGFVLAMSALSNSVFADSDPSLHQVYEAAKAGRLDEARGMMDKVLKDHPNSAKAHFVEAELLAQQGQLANAESELNNAERLEPGLPFANQQTVQGLENRIAAAHEKQPVANGVQRAAGNGFPWSMLLLGIGTIAVIVLVIRALQSRRNSAVPAIYQPNLQGTPGASVQSYGPTGIGGGLGSGIIGGLATGAAVGAGMVAGEALAHHFMDGPSNTASAGAAPRSDDSWARTSDDLGGTDFGIADNSSWDDGGSSFASTDLGGDDWS